MLSVGSKFAFHAISSVRSSYKAAGRVTKSKPLSRRPWASNPILRAISYSHSHLRPSRRDVHMSSVLRTTKPTVESYLQEVSILASQVTPAMKEDKEKFSRHLERQVLVMKKALSQAVKQNRADKVKIFVSLVEMCDMHQLYNHVVELVEANMDLMVAEESVRAGMYGQYAEALFEARRFGDAQKAAETNSALLFKLPGIHAHTLILSLFLLATMEHYCSLTDEAILTYKRALAIAKKIERTASESDSKNTSDAKNGLESKSASDSKNGLESQNAANSLKRDDATSPPSPSSPLSIPSPNLPSDSPPIESKAVRHHLLAKINSNIGRLLSDSGRTEEALPYLTAAIEARETLLKRDPTNEESRDHYVAAIEALSVAHAVLNSFNASRHVWERASLLLEYGGDSSELISKEVEETEQQLQQPIASKPQLAAINHRHGKALLACNTKDSIANSLRPITKACDLFRELGDHVSLLDALEDLSHAYEALAYVEHPSSGNADGEPTAYLDEQVAIFGECLTENQQIHGPLHPDNAKYLTNLAIFTSAKGETQRANDSIRAAVYICEKAGLSEDDEIFGIAKAVQMYLTNMAEKAPAEANSPIKKPTKAPPRPGSARALRQQGKYTKM